MCKEDTPKDGQGSLRIPPFLTVKQFPQYFSWPSESGLRYYIFHAKENGLDSAILKVGRRVIIESDKYILWMRNQGKN